MGHLPLGIANQNKLYWCWAEDHMEDCFVVAHSKTRANQIFADYNGYVREETTTEMVAEPSLSSDYLFTEGLADDDDIRAYGGRILLDKTPRVVAFGERMFREGCFEPEPGTPVNDSDEEWSMERIAKAVERAFPSYDTLKIDGQKQKTNNKAKKSKK